MTPFAALSMMLIASLLLVLLESGRVYVLDRFATLKAEAGMDSVCAEFQPFLWKEYGLLFLDGAYGAEHFSLNYVSESLEEQIHRGMEDMPGLNFLAFEEIQVAVLGYALATDKEGEVFLNYVSEREKESLPVGVAEDLYEQYQNGKQMEEQYGGAKEKMEEAKHVTEELMLEEVIGEVPSKELEGNMEIEEDTDWYRKLLILQYMEQYFSNYLQEKPEHALSYEMEYVLCGKDTDSQNLESACNRIRWFRTACNMAAIQQDQEKMLLAEGIARVAALLVGESEAVVKILKAGIVAMWAYMDAGADVQRLLAGEKVAIMEKGLEWGYIDYLKCLLFFTSDSKLAYRMMGAMELSMKEQTPYKNCCMSHMIVALEYEIVFKAKPLFSSLVTIGKLYDGSFYFKENVSRSYIP